MDAGDFSHGRCEPPSEGVNPTKRQVRVETVALNVNAC